MGFNYSEDELPNVTEGVSYMLGDKSLAEGETITYYNVGGWSFSNLDVEDGNLEHARASALAWIAWFNYLEANPEVTVDTFNKKVEN